MQRIVHNKVAPWCDNTRGPGGQETILREEPIQ